MLQVDDRKRVHIVVDKDCEGREDAETLRARLCVVLHSNLMSVFWNKISSQWWPRAARHQLQQLQMRMSVTTEHTDVLNASLDKLIDNYIVPTDQAGYFQDPSRSKGQKMTAEQREIEDNWTYPAKKQGTKSRSRQQRRFSSPFLFKTMTDVMRCLHAALPLDEMQEAESPFAKTQDKMRKFAHMRYVHELCHLFREDSRWFHGGVDGDNPDCYGIRAEFAPSVANKL